MELMETQTPSQVTIQMRSDVQRSDLVKGLVWFVNYAALDPTAVKASDLDLKGTAMLPEDVELFAHRWLAYSRSIDIEHDGVGRPIHVIESFFNSPEVGAAAWPLNSHAVRMDVSASKEAVDGLRNGTLNSVSLDAFTFNRTVRLPVAKTMSAAGPGIPDSFEDWAKELVQMGYDDVQSVGRVSSGLYIVQRSAGRTPLAVAISEADIDVSPASDPWARIAASVMTSPTLRREGAVLGAM
jgi:hypothetical protein